MIVKNKKQFQDYKGIKGNPIYDKFLPLIPLYGNSYVPIIKACFYFLLGDCLKDNIIIVGKTMEDTRINLFVPLPSGHGKKIIEEFVKNSVERDEEYGRYIQPTSYHPEQLVGRTNEEKQRGRIVYTQNPGHLAENVVVFGEAIEFFTNKEHEDGRNYVLKALDPIGQNELVKRGVRIPREHTLRYMPYCSMLFFAQPLPLPPHVFERGLLRRMLIIYIKEIPPGERFQAITERTKKSVDNNALWREFITLLKNLRKKKCDWEFSDEVLSLIEEKTIFLIQRGFSGGQKSKEFTEIYFFILHNLMMKMSVVHAAVDGRSNVVVDDVMDAFVDLSEFWKLHLDFIVSKVMKTTSLDKHKRIIVDILEKKECFSKEECNLTIQELLNEFCKRTEKAESTARYHYRELKRRGVIDSEQEGQYGSKVWLLGYKHNP